MVAKKYSIKWDKKASTALKAIHSYYKQKSNKAADNIKNDIIKAVKGIVFENQYQTEEYLPKVYRRIIVRKNYKVIYRVNDTEIRIVHVFDTRQNPDKIDDLD